MVERNFIQDDQIVVYRMDAMDRLSVESWAQLVRKTGDDWPAQQPYCSIQDFSAHTILTPALRHHAEQLNQYFAGKPFPKMLIAVVTKKTPLSIVAKLFIERDLYSGKMKRRLFFSVDDATAWLLSELGT